MKTQDNYVDLGLSVKWATCNLGATKPEEYGDYYDWGETETKDDVAHIKLGGNWRMPTDKEWNDLEENCTWEWTDDYYITIITMITIELASKAI